MKNNYLLVEIDRTHNQTRKLGKLELIRPDEWVVEATVNDGAVYDFNRDLRETEPQIATVVVPNDKSNLKAGDKVFIHYLCAKNGIPAVYEEKECTAIFVNQVYFVINDDGSISPTDGVYLGKQRFKTSVTDSGIWTTSNGLSKEVLKIELTHLPPDNKYFKVGEIALSIDDYQYQLKYEGETYIKLFEREIVGVLEPNQVQP